MRVPMHFKHIHTLERVVSWKRRGRLISNVKWNFNSTLSKIWDSSIFIRLIYVEVLQKTEPRFGFRSHNSCCEPEHPFKHWVYIEDDLLWPWPGLKCVRMFPFWQAVRDGTAAWGEVSGSLFGGGDWADQTSTWKTQKEFSIKPLLSGQKNKADLRWGDKN